MSLYISSITNNSDTFDVTHYGNNKSEFGNLNLKKSGGNLSVPASIGTSATIAATNYQAYTLNNIFENLVIISSSTSSNDGTGGVYSIYIAKEGSSPDLRMQITDSGSINMNMYNDSNFILNNANSSINIKAIGGGINQQLLLESDGTSNSAINIYTPNGGINISANNQIEIETNDLTNGILIGVNSASVPITIGNVLSTTTIGDNLVVKGDLTVDGAMFTISSSIVNITDNVIVVNATPSATRDGGFVVKRFQKEVNDGSGDIVNDDSPMETGTLVNATSQSFTLPNTSNVNDQFYKNFWIKITNNSPVGSFNQVRQVTNYVGSSRFADINTAWVIIPDSTTTYALYDRNYVGMIWHEAETRLEFTAIPIEAGVTTVTYGHYLDIECNTVYMHNDLTLPNNLILTSYTPNSVLLTDSLSNVITGTYSTLTSNNSFVVRDGSGIIQGSTITLTGQTAFGAIYLDGSRNIQSATLTNGQLLIGSSGGYPIPGSIKGTTNQISVTNGSGSITLSLPQDISTNSNVTFNQITSKTNVIIQNNGLIELYETSNTYYTSLTANSSITQSLNFVLPIDYGTNNQSLTTDGSGNLAWNSMQPLNSQLTALANYNQTGIMVRTGANSFSGRTIFGTTNQINVTNGDGINGDIIIGTVQNIGVTSSPTFNGLTLTNPLGISSGGTNSSTSLNNNRIMVSSGGSIIEGVALTDGQLYIGKTGGLPMAASLTPVTNQTTIGYAPGVITVGTVQNIGITSSPTFGGITLTGNVIIENGDGVLFYESTNTNYMKIISNSGLSQSYTLTLPLDVGTSNQSLITDGSGVLSWKSMQPLDPTLSGLSGFTSTGIMVQTSAYNFAGRKITSNNSTINITNGDGVSGNINIALPQSVSISATPTFGGLTITGDTLITNNSNLIINDSSNGRSVSIKAPGTLTNSYTLTLPIANGSMSQVLANDGSGGLYWASAATSSPNLTALSSFNTPGILVYQGSNVFVGRTIQGTTNQITITNGDGVSGDMIISTVQDINTISSPTFNGLTLTNALGISSGGTNSSTALNNNRMMVSFSGKIIEGSALTNGQIFIGSTGSLPVASSITGTLNQIIITNGNGSITVSTPQNIDTTSNVAFNSLTLASNIVINGNGYIELTDSSTGTIKLIAPSSVTSYTLTLPTSSGTNGYSLITDGSGTLSWSQMQSYSLTLTALSVFNSNGIMVQTNVNTFTSRSIISSNSTISITNGNGVNGNMDITLPQSVSTSATPTFNGLTLNGSLNIMNQNALVLYELTTNGSKNISIIAPGSFGTSYTLTLPINTGSNGMALITDGTGVLSWSAVQVYSASLTNFAAMSSLGILIQTTVGNYTARKLTSSNSTITITNPDGISGNIDITLPQSISISATPTFGGLTLTSDLNIDNNSLIKLYESTNTYYTGIQSANISASYTMILPLTQGNGGLTNDGNGNLSWVSYQPLSSTLTSLSTFNSNGIMVQTSLNNFTSRSITSSNSTISITNGNGVSGNIDVTLPQSISTSASPTFNGLTLTNPLGISSGGTNSSVSLNNNRIMVSSSGAIIEGSALLDGQLYIGKTGALPVAGYITFYDANQGTVNVGSGTIQLQLAQDIGTSSNVTFANETLNGNLTLNNNGQIQLKELTGSGTKYISIQAPTTVTATYNLILPNGQGSGGLTNDGNGNLSWVSYQPLSTSLTNFAAMSNTGIIVQTSSGNYTNRSVISNSGLVQITNGNGVSGNIDLTIAQDISTSANVQFASVSSNVIQTYGSNSMTIKSGVSQSSGGNVIINSVSTTPGYITIQQNGVDSIKVNTDGSISLVAPINTNVSITTSGSGILNVIGNMNVTGTQTIGGLSSLKVNGNYISVNENAASSIDSGLFIKRYQTENTSGTGDVVTYQPNYTGLLVSSGTSVTQFTLPNTLSGYNVTNYFQNYWVLFTSGSNNNYVRQIVSQTNTGLCTLSSAVAVTPSTGDTFTLSGNNYVGIYYDSLNNQLEMGYVPTYPTTHMSPLLNVKTVNKCNILTGVTNQLTFSYGQSFTTILTVPTPSANRIITLSDLGVDASIVLTNSNSGQTINGGLTLGTALGISSGGTNSSASLNNNRIMVSSGGSIIEGVALTNGQLYIGKTGALPVAGSITFNNVNQGTVNLGSGTIQLQLAQNIGTVSTPTFSGLTILNQGSVILNDTGLNNVTIESPSAIITSYVLTLPTSSGTNGYSLITDGTGVLSWSRMQTYSATLAALSVFNSNGIMVQTAQNNFTSRKITSSSGDLTITNPDGVSGNIDIIVSSTATLSISSLTLTTPLSIGSGGTNSASALNNNRIMVSSSGAIIEGVALTNGQLYIGKTGALPVAGSITFNNANQGTVNLGAGTIQLQLAQNIGTTSSVTFGSLTLGTSPLGISSGGTNSSVSLNNNRMMVSSSGSIIEASALTNGQIFIGSTGVLPVAGSITFTNANQGTVNLGAGTIQLQLAQDIGTSSNVTFGSLTLALSPLNITSGGTNSSVGLNNNRIMVSSGGAIIEGVALTNGQLYIGNTGSLPSAGLITFNNANQGKVNIGAGTIQLQLAQDIGTSSTPTFNGMNINSDISLTGNLDVLNNNAVKLYELSTNGSFYVGLVSAASLSGNLTFVLPNSYGTNGYSLITDGTGVLSWSQMQTYSAVLTGLSGLNGTGILVQTGASSFTNRSITSSNSTITITNPGGVSGNIDITIPQNVSTSATPTFGGLTLNGVLNGQNIVLSNTSNQIVLGTTKTITLNGVIPSSSVIYTIPDSGGAASFIMSTSGSGQTIGGGLTINGGLTSSVATLQNTTNQIILGSGTTITISGTAPVSNVIYTIPDAGNNANFILSTSSGGQTINGGLTVNGGLNLPGADIAVNTLTASKSTNQIILGSGTTITLNAAVVGANRVYTIPDAGAGCNFIMGTSSSGQTISGGLTVASGLIISSGNVSLTSGNVIISSGTLTSQSASLTNTSNQLILGTTKTTTLTATAPFTSVIYTIPDVGGNASFIMSTSSGGQNISGGLTVNGGLNLTSTSLTIQSVSLTNTINQIVLGTTNTITLSGPSPVSSVVYTIPDTGGSATFIMSTNGSAQTISGGLSIGGGLTISSGNFSLTSGTLSGQSITLSNTSNQLVLGTTKTTTITATAPSSSLTYTIPDVGGAASFIMSTSGSGQTISGGLTVTGGLNIGSTNLSVNTLTASATTNQLILGTTNTTTISATAPASSLVYTIPDAGGAASFVMTNYTGGQSISGGLTINTSLTISPNTILLSGTNPVIQTSSGNSLTLQSQGSADLILTSGSANLKTNSTSMYFTGSGTTTIYGPSNQNVIYTTQGTGSQTVSTGATSSASTNSGILYIQTGNATGTTSSSGDININTGSATSNIGAINIQQNGSNRIVVSSVGAITLSGASNQNITVTPNGTGIFTSTGLTLSNTSNQLVLGVTKTITLTGPTPSSSVVYTIPDGGGNATFIMSAFGSAQSISGGLSIGGGLTVSSGNLSLTSGTLSGQSISLTNTSNQLILGTTKTTTITATIPSSSLVYTIPDAGGNASFIMSTSGSGQSISGGLTISGTLSILSNTISLNGTNPVIQTSSGNSLTLQTQGSADLILTSGSGNLKTNSTSLYFTGSGTTTIYGPLNQNVIYTTQGTGAQIVSTAVTSSASTNSGGITIQTGNASGTTSNSGGIILNTGSATGTIGSINLQQNGTNIISISSAGAITLSALSNQNITITPSGTGIFTSTGLTLSNTSNQLILGTTNTVTINSAAPTASRVYNIPDIGSNGSFIMSSSSGGQTINNGLTVGSGLTISSGNLSLTSGTLSGQSITLSNTSNQLILGTTKTTTITATAPSSSIVYTIPDTGSAASFIMSTSGSGQTISGGLTVTGGLSLTSTSLTIQSLSLTNTSNQLVLGTTNTITLTGPTPANNVTYTIPDAGGNATFIMNTFGSVQSISGGLTISTGNFTVTSGTLSGQSQTLTNTSNQLVLGVTKTITLTGPTPGASVVYTIPDSGGNATFIMSTFGSSQSISGGLSVGGGLTISSGNLSLTSGTLSGQSISLTNTSNQLVLGTTNTTTITATVPASSLTYTIPDAGGAASFILSTSGSGQTISGGLTVTGGLTLTSTSLSIQSISLTNTTNQLVLGTTKTITLTGPTPGASVTYTIPDAGGAATFIMSTFGSAQSIAGGLSIGGGLTVSSGNLSLTSGTLSGQSITLSNTSNQLVLGTTKTTTITATQPSSSVVYTIPDSGGNATFIMSAFGSAQSISGGLTISTGNFIVSSGTLSGQSQTLTNTSNQLVLGTTKTTTISATAPASSLTYTIPDAGGAASFIMSTSGSGQTISGGLTVNGGLTLTSTSLSIQSVTLTNTSNQLVLGTTKTITLTGPTPGASVVYTIPDAGGAATFIMSTFGSTQSIAGGLSIGGGLTISSGNLSLTSGTLSGQSITLSNTSNQLILGTTKTTTISATAPSSSVVYTIPDAGGAANFIMSTSGSGQTIGGGLTINTSLTISPNTVSLTGTNPVIQTSTGNSLTLQSQGTADIILTSGSGNINTNATNLIFTGSGTTTIKGPSNQSIIYTTQGTGSQTVSTSATSSSSTNSGAINITTGNATGLTSNSGSIIMTIGTATGTSGTFSLIQNSNTLISTGTGGSISITPANNQNITITPSGSGVFSSTSLTLSNTSNQLVLGITKTITLTGPTPGASVVYTIPDSGGNASFIMSSFGSAQSISGGLTISSGNFTVSTGNISVTSGSITSSNLVLTGASNQIQFGSSTAIIISAAAVGTNRNYLIPDVGSSSATFIMTTSSLGQTISGGLTVASGLTISSGNLSLTSGTISGQSVTLTNTSNQIILGTTKTTTISATQPSSSLVYTIPDAGGAASFIMSTSGSGQTISGGLTVTGGLTLTSTSLSIQSVTLTNTTNQITLNANTSKTLILTTPASMSGNYTYTIPDVGGSASFIMSTSGSGQTISSGLTVGGGLTVSTSNLTVTSGIVTSQSHTLTNTSNQLILGTTNTTTISATAPVSSVVYTIPDAGGAASFIMSTSGSGQTINGGLTVNGGLNIGGTNLSVNTITASATSNQIILGTTNTITLTGPSPVSSVVYTIPDAGGSATFIMSSFGTAQTISGGLSVGGGLTITSGTLTGLSQTLTNTSNQIVLGTTKTITLSGAIPSSSVTYTIADVGTNASFVMTNSTGGQSISGGFTLSGTSNQLILGTTKTITLTGPTPGSSRIYTIPDVNVDTSFMMINSNSGQSISGGLTINTSLTISTSTISLSGSNPVIQTSSGNSLTLQSQGTADITLTSGSGNINTNATNLIFTGSGTTTVKGPSNQSIIYTTQGTGSQTVSTSVTSSTSTNSGAINISTGNATGLTSNSGGITMTIGTATGTSGIFSLIQNGNTLMNTGTGGSITYTLPSNQTYTISTSGSGTVSTPNIALTGGSNQIIMGSSNTITLTTGSLTGSRVYTLIDAGGAANIILSTSGSGQTISGGLTVSGGLTLPSTSLSILSLTLTNTTNQIVLGTTNTVTISSTAPSASRIYTLPDAGGAASFILSTSGSGQTIGGGLTVNGGLNIGSSSLSVLTLTASATTNQIILGTTNTVTITSPAPVASRTYTIPDIGGNASFIMSTSTGGQTIGGSLTLGTNTLALNGTNPIIQTLSGNSLTLQTQGTADITLTSGSGNINTNATNLIFTGSGTTTVKGPSNQTIIYTTQGTGAQTISTASLTGASSGAISISTGSTTTSGTSGSITLSIGGSAVSSGIFSFIQNGATLISSNTSGLVTLSPASGQNLVITVASGGIISTNTGTISLTGTSPTISTSASTTLTINSSGASGVLNLQQNSVTVISLTSAGAISETPVAGQGYTLSTTTASNISGSISLSIATGTSTQGIYSLSQGGNTIITTSTTGGLTLASYGNQNVIVNASGTLNLQQNGSTIISIPGAITMTPASGQNITMTLSGGGIFQTNTGTLSLTGTNPIINTSGTNTLTIQTLNQSTVATASAAITISSGTSTTSGNTGLVTITTGAATSGTSGGVSITTGTGTTASGNITLQTGGGTSSTGGSIILNTQGTSAFGAINIEQGGSIRIGVASSGAISLTSASNQNITITPSGSGVFSSTAVTLSNTSNQLILGTTKTTTITATAPATSLTYTIPDAGGAASFILSTSGSGQTIIGGLTMGNNTEANTINIGQTSNGSRTINIGNSVTNPNLVFIGDTNGASSITMKVGTGNYLLDGAVSSTITFGTSLTTGTITIGGTAQTGNITLGSSSGTNTVIIGGGSGATTVNIANGVTGNTISLGNGNNTSAQIINIASGAPAANSTVNIMNGVATLGTQTINMATGASATTINMGSTTGTSGMTIKVGTGNYLVDGAASSTMTWGTSLTTGTITIGGTAQTGNITLGSSSGTNSVLIGNGTGVTTVSIANGTNANIVNIANGNTTGNTVVNILAGTGTLGSASLNIGDNPTVTAIDVGNVVSLAARTVTMMGGNQSQNNTYSLLSGNHSAGTQTVNIMAGVSTGGTQTVNIANGASASTVNIGNTTGASAVNINVGSGNLNITGGGSTTGEFNTYSTNFFQAYVSTTYTPTLSGTPVVVKFDTESLGRIGSAFSTTTGQFTAAKTGYYLIQANVVLLMPTGASNRTIGVYRGGAAITGTVNTINTRTNNAQESLVVMVIISVTANDVIDIRLTGVSTDKIIAGSTFNASLIRI